jgi:DNA replication protein DnaC
MTDDNLEHELITLKLHWLAANLNDVIARATKSRSGPREILAEIARAELHDRSARSTERRLKDARLGRVKPMTEFDWAWPRSIDREAIEKALALDFLNDDANVILAGPQGVGKSQIARNIAHNAVMAGHTALVTTAANLVNDLGSQESSRALESRIRHYLKPGILVVDEIGYLSFDCRAADLFFQVVSRRYESGPMVLTTNLTFKEWTTVFPGAACLVAMIDRLTHHSEIIPIDADSYRSRENQERLAKKKKTKKSLN